MAISASFPVHNCTTGPSHPQSHNLSVSLVNSIHFNKKKPKQTDHLSLSRGVFGLFASNVITDK